MKINTILSVFAPKEVKFFSLLQETAVILDQAAALSETLFSSEDQAQRKDLSKQIKAEEIKGDKVTGRIFKALNRTFITPFDREDVGALADEMDDAIDAINRSAQKVLLYSPETLPVSTSRLAGIIKLETAEVLAAIRQLSDLKRFDKRIHAHTKEIKRLEEKADTVYEEGITTLFKDETNTIELIKLKEIIQELEKSANKINNIGKILKTIVVKYT
jgi:predicted phosphate transport protein (TIGR00153 family)